jgi:thiol:disulfide interchange protein DsbA
MNRFRTLLAVTAALFLVACGGADEPLPAADETLPDGPTATQDAAPEAPEPSTEEEAPDAQKLEPVEESAADASESAAGEDDEIVIAEAESAAAPAPPQKYSEGQHYTVLTTAQGTSSSPDVVEVAEVFWYGCPHCYNFEPYVARWEQGLAEGVELVRLPVMWNPTNEIHARMFYTAEALGKLDEMHPAIFREMHSNGKQFTQEADIEEYFGGFGVSAEDFRSTFRSFPVETRLKKAKNLTQRYRIQSVPLLVVNGKYVAGGPGVKTFEDMIAVANELVAREQAEL